MRLFDKILLVSLLTLFVVLGAVLIILSVQQ